MSRSRAKFRSARPPLALPRRFRPRLDALERRELLATLTVTSPADSGPGTLRAQVASAASGDTIDFAASLRGQTITLTSGTIIDAARSLAIVGPGAEDLTISGGDVSGIFLFDGGNGSPPIDVSISGVTLADGLAQFGSGGAVLAAGTNLTITDIIFRSNSAPGLGGAVAVFGPFSGTPVEVTIVDAQFLGNTSSTFGGGLFTSGALVTLDGTTFDGNSAPFFAGGGALIDGPSLSVIDSTFTANTGVGGLAFFGRTNTNVAPVATIDDSRFEGNVTSGFGGGVYVLGDAIITDSIFEENAAIGHPFAQGGALYVSGAATIDDSRFVGNLVQGQFSSNGGAIGLGGGLTSVISDTLFEGNTAIGSGASGGAVFVFSFSFGGIFGQRSLRFEGDTFRDNQALSGPASSFGGSVSGGALDIPNYDGQVVIEDSKFLGNRAVAEANASGQGLSASGGAIRAFGGFPFGGTTGLTIRDTTFDGNAAVAGSGSTSGGFASGGAIFGLSGFLTVTIEGSRFKDNQAVGGDAGGAGNFAGVGFGGAIIFFGPAIVVTDTDFLHNVARGGDGTAGANGGIGYAGAVSAAGTFTDVTFQGNEALGGAGGAAIAGGVAGSGGPASGGALATFGTTTVRSAKFLNNSAIGGRGGSGSATGTGGAGGEARGGGIVIEFGSLDVLDSLFVHNQALGGAGGAGATAGVAGAGFGGGIANFGAIVRINKKTKFNANRATTAGNDIFGPYTKI